MSGDVDDLRLWMTEAREAELRRNLTARGVTKVNARCLRCADLLDRWLGGLHHFPGGEKALRRTEWDHPVCVEVTIVYKNLATFDGSLLTALVFLAHDLAIRAEVTPCNMQRVTLRLHPRRRGGDSGWERHPTLAEAVAAWCVRYPRQESDAAKGGAA